MSKRTKVAVLSFSLAVVLFTVIGGLSVKASTSDGAYRQIGVYSEVLSRIRSEYVEEPDIPHVTDGALHGMLEALDANSSYLDPAEYKAFKQLADVKKDKDMARENGLASGSDQFFMSGEAGKGHRGNVGATISKRYGYAAVVSVIPGGPADKAGLDSGDILEAIEGKSTREMSLAEVQGVMSGAVGSTVTVSVVRARRAEPVKATITRDIVNVPAVQDKTIEDGIGYIKADALTKGKSGEIASKIKALQKSGAKKLILDLRNTAEGSEAEGVAVANLFLNHGTIAYLQGQTYQRQTFNADPSKAVTDLPLVVLVNHGTAGAAEIVAASVLENNRGDVLGDKTFGAGSVQKVFEQKDGSALILTIAKYYTPGGKAIQDTAITPNIMVADKDDDFILPDEDSGSGETGPLRKPERKGDEQLRRAIEVMKNSQQKAML